MTASIRGFCILAIFCGTALRLAPEGSIKRIMSVLVTAALLLQLFASLGLRDLDALADDLGRMRESEQRFSQETDALRQRLDRLVIEDELRTYILNKAAQQGIDISEIELELHWQTEGYWLPRAVTLHGSASGREAAALARIVSAELGIRAENVRWNENDGMEEHT